MVTVEETESGSAVSGYLSRPGDVDRVLMSSRDVSVHGRFAGEFTTWGAGGLVGCDVLAEGPTRATSLCDWPPGVFVLGALVEGQARFADSTVRRDLPSSAVLLYPGNGPFLFDFADAFRYVIVKATARDLGVTTAGLNRLAGSRVVEPTPFASALGALLADGGSWADRSPTRGAELGDEVARLVRRMVRVSDERHFGVGAKGESAVLLEWIEERLPDPDLGPAAIAAAHHMSVRQVHRVFTDLGITCRRYITRRRLERIRADLTTSTRPVAATGLRWGFDDPAYLSKAFKREFGVSPSRVRRSQE